MKLNKKAKLSIQIVTTALIVILALIILFEFYSDAVPIAQEAGDSLNATNQCSSLGGFWNSSVDRCQTTAGTETVLNTFTGEIPLSSLFSSNGIVFIIVMAALLILVVTGIMTKKAK